MVKTFFFSPAHCVRVENAKARVAWLGDWRSKNGANFYHPGQNFTLDLGNFAVAV